MVGMKGRTWACMGCAVGLVLVGVVVWRAGKLCNWIPLWVRYEGLVLGSEVLADLVLRVA